MSKGFALILSSLQATPWQSYDQLNAALGYDAGKTLDRMRKRGLIVRRVGDRPRNKYEYAKAEGA